jgi:phenylacetate-CoA ligase
VKLPLREGVIIEEAEPGVELVDGATGLRLGLPEASAALFEGGSGEGGDDLRALLSAWGLLEEGLSLGQVEERQRAQKRAMREVDRAEGLRELLEFATQRVSYYRDRKDAYAPSVSRVRSLEDLRRLPLMKRSDLRAHFPDGLVADGLDVPALLEAGALELASTSGSTGERVQVFAAMDLDSVPPIYEELWDLPPSDETPKTAVFTTPLCLGNQCHLGRATYEERIREGSTLYLNSTEDLFSLGRPLLANIAEELERFQPDFLLVNPVYLHWLYRRAAELNVALPKVSLVLSCYQYLTAIQRRAIEAYAAAPVYNYYFATDLAGSRIAIECKERRLHVREDHALVEVVGEAGPRAEGELGSLAVTALTNRVMPLVRYLIGDVGRLTGETCSCAAADWDVLELHGRLKDMLFRDRWISPREVDEAVADTPGLDFYKCLQVGESELRVQAIPALGVELRRTDLVDRLRERLGFATVHVKEVRRLDPEASLKFRLTEHRAAAPPEFLL